MSRQEFTKESVAKVENRPGNYYFYGRAGNLLYVGWSSILKHRLQSYYQKDSFKAHPTKRALRPRIAFFSVVYRPLDQAKKVEMRMKSRAPFKFMKAGGLKRR